MVAPNFRVENWKNQIWYYVTCLSVDVGAGKTLSRASSKCHTLVLTELCEFLVHERVVNFYTPSLVLAEITVKATVKDYS
jgi:hypothetical protein